MSKKWHIRSAETKDRSIIHKFYTCQTNETAKLTEELLKNNEIFEVLIMKVQYE